MEMPQIHADSFTESDLPSVKFYEMLKKDSMELQSKNFSFCSEFSPEYDKNEQIKKLCSKYVFYLKRQEKIWSQYEYSDYCNMLIYWVSDVLLKTLGKNQSKCTHAFREIQGMWRSATLRDPTSYKCLPYNSIISYYDKWENAKKLYDYYIDFANLNKMTNNCAVKCQKLCSYLSEINDIYKSYKDFCSGKENHLCPLSKIKYEQCNPRSLLNKFNCDTSTEVIQFPKEKPSAEEKEDGSVQKAEEAIVNEVEESSVEVVPSNQYSIEDSQENSELISAESKPLSAFGNSLLGLVLASMLFGVLYKFTPIGRQIRNNIPIIANMINKLSKKGNRPPTHRLETYNPFCEYLEENYIGYNPV